VRAGQERRTTAAAGRGTDKKEDRRIDSEREGKKEREHRLLSVSHNPTPVRPYKQDCNNLRYSFFSLTHRTPHTAHCLLSPTALQVVFLCALSFFFFPSLAPPSIVSFHHHLLHPHPSFSSSLLSSPPCSLTHHPCTQSPRARKHRCRIFDDRSKPRAAPADSLPTPIESPLPPFLLPARSSRLSTITIHSRPRSSPLPKATFSMSLATRMTRTGTRHAIPSLAREVTSQ